MNYMILLFKWIMRKWIIDNVFNLEDVCFRKDFITLINYQLSINELSVKRIINYQLKNYPLYEVRFRISFTGNSGGTLKRN